MKKLEPSRGITTAPTVSDPSKAICHSALWNGANPCDWPNGTRNGPTLLSVIGVRRADNDSQLPRSVEVRLRVENTSPFRVKFDPGSVALFSAGLQRFPDPILHPPATADLGPGESVVMEAFFPFPDDESFSDFDLSGLNVRWTMDIDGHQITSSASFARLPQAYYDRYPNRIGVGYGRYDC